MQKKMILFMSVLSLILVFAACQQPMDVATSVGMEKAVYPAWDASAEYKGGTKVTHASRNWNAKWWTTNEEPGTTGQWGVWEDIGPADGTSTATPTPEPTATIPPTVTSTVQVTPTNEPTATATATTGATATPTPQGTVGTCNESAWNSSTAYWGGDTVHYNGHHYKAKWWTQGDNPATTNVWEDLGACGDVIATATPTATPTSDGPTATPTPYITPTPRPYTPFTGRALVGYWETWDATIHSAGHIPLNDINSKYNVICIAFPVIHADGTCVFEDGMAPTEDVPTREEIAQAQAAGKKVLLSIGGAAAHINLTSTAVADKFIETCTRILQENGFDGIDIDIESGLLAGGSYSTLSTSQTNLIRIINGIMDNFGPNFMLTMAPETAYVTGGGVAYGNAYGAYLRIINDVRDRISWIQMQYYNGVMYGKGGTSYNAGTVEGMVQQTFAMIEGFPISGGGTFQGLGAEKVVVGLPAITGAANSGYMTPSSVHTAMNQIKAKHPNIRGLMTWSINWDASNGYEFANNHGPYLDGLGAMQ